MRSSGPLLLVPNDIVMLAVIAPLTMSLMLWATSPVTRLFSLLGIIGRQASTSRTLPGGIDSSAHGAMNRDHWAQVAIVASFLVLGAAFGFAIPAWEAPDEVAHMRFVEHLVANRSLPVQRKGVFGEEHQAPLYYVIAALPVSFVDLHDATGAFRWNHKFGWSPGDDVNAALHQPGDRFAFRGRALALRLVRLLSTLMGAVTVGLTMVLSSRVMPGHGAVCLLAASLVAFNAQFIFISAATNNDNLLTLCFAGCLAQLAGIVSASEPPGRRAWLWVGLWWSVALLAKTSALTLLPTVALALLLRWWRGDPVGVLARAAVATLGLVAALTGWWFLRNQWLYGDPLGLTPFLGNFGPADALSFQNLPDVLSTQFMSFWGWFGWLTVPAPRWFYLGMGGLTVVSLAGLAKLVVQRSRSPLEGTTYALVLLAFAVVVQEVFQLRASATFGRSWAQGRYLFPILPSGALLSAVGLSTIIPRRCFPVATLAVAVLVACSAMYLLVAVILPAYPFA